jgi:hypothetical protein
MKARTPSESKGRKATASATRRRPGCRDCRFCAPSGRCLETTIRSGRCGDWAWYVLPGNRQCRRLWVKPRDPRTPSQRYWRALLGAASRKFSESLTDEQQDACISAGGQAALSATPGGLGLAHWPAVLGFQGVRGECRRKKKEGRKARERAANTGDFATHMGYAP